MSKVRIDGLSAKKDAEDRLHAISDSVSIAIVAKHFSGKRLDITKLADREGAVLYRLKDAAGVEKVLRLSSNAHWRAGNAAKSYRTWQDLGVPVPKVFACGEASNLQYIIMEFLHEEVFDFGGTTEQQIAVMRGMGSLLAAMHMAKAQGHGYLNHEGRGTFDSWHDFLSYRYSPVWIVEAGHLSPEQAEQMTRFITSIAHKHVEPVLLHGDFKPKNMFVGDDGSIVAVTDPQPLAGDALWDVAIYNHFIYRQQAREDKDFNDPGFIALRSAFIDAYTQNRGSELSEDETSRIAGYECLINAEKVEKLLRKNNNLEEGQRILLHLQFKLSQPTEF